MARAIVSVVPPADAPTRSLIGRDGIVVGSRGWARQHSAATAKLPIFKSFTLP